MSTNFPASLDTFTNPAPTDNLSTVSHSGQHDNINDAMAQVQAKVGANGSVVTTSLDYRVQRMAGAAALTRSTASFMTVDPAAATLAVTLSSQIVQLIFFYSPLTFTTTQCRFTVVVNATSSSAGTGVGLYSVDGSDNCTLIASVASTSLFTSAGSVTASWAAGVALTTGARYAIGFLNNAGTGTPTLAGSSPANALASGEFAIVPRLTGTRSGQTSVPASIAVGNINTTVLMPFAVIL